MDAEFIVEKMFGTHFFKVPRECVRMWGLSKASFFAYLYDLKAFAEFQGQESFYCTYEKAQNDLGLDPHTIAKYLKFFLELGVLVKLPHKMREKAFYKIDCGTFVALIERHASENNTSATFENVKIPVADYWKNPVGLLENSSSGLLEKSHSNENIYNKILKESKQIYSASENLKAEKPKKESPFDFMAYAAEKWDKAESKLCKREEWLDFMAAKNIALKAKRKSITQKMVDLNFNELYKLNEIGENVSARLEKATAEGWQGIWFDRDSREWNKRGACFKSNVTSDTIDYGATPTDSRIAKITTTYKLN